MRNESGAIKEKIKNERPLNEFALATDDDDATIYLSSRLTQKRKVLHNQVLRAFRVCIKKEKIMMITLAFITLCRECLHPINISRRSSSSFFICAAVYVMRLASWNAA